MLDDWEAERRALTQRALDPRRTGRLPKGDLKRALRAALEGKRDVHGRATPEVRQAPPRQ